MKSFSSSLGWRQISMAEDPERQRAREDLKELGPAILSPALDRLEEQVGMLRLLTPYLDSSGDVYEHTIDLLSSEDRRKADETLDGRSLYEFFAES